MLVREGVLCTKAPGDFGPCTKNRGVPDPARCSVSCLHRLETSAARKDLEHSIAILQKKLENPTLVQQPMLQKAYEGQLRAHMKRQELYHLNAQQEPTS